MEDGTLILKQRFPSPNPRIELFVVTYWCQGLKIKGLLGEPKEDGRYDGFLYLRGGIKNVGKVRVGRIVQFASEGFVVMAPFYRGNQGGEGNEDFAGEDRYDAIAALALLRNNKKVKKERVHVFGFSRGGVMALITGIMDSYIKSIVCWGGVSDMTLTYDERLDLRKMMKRVIGGTPNKVPDAYKWRTPIFYIEKVQAPVLLIHGEKDHNVSIEHSYRLEKRLKELQMPVETWYFEGFTHYFPPAINRKIVQDLTGWMKKQ